MHPVSGQNPRDRATRLWLQLELGLHGGVSVGGGEFLSGGSYYLGAFSIIPWIQRMLVGFLLSHIHIRVTGDIKGNKKLSCR